MPSNDDTIEGGGNEDDVIAVLDAIDAFTLVAYMETRQDVKAIQRKTATRKVIEATIAELDTKIAAELADTVSICADGGVIPHEADKLKFAAIIESMLVDGSRLDNTTGPTLSSMASRVTTYIDETTPAEDTLEGGNGDDTITGDDTLEGEE